MPEGFVNPNPGNGSGGAAVSEALQKAATEEAIKEAAPPPAPVEVWPIKVKLLHKKILNERNQEIEELEFRQPTGGDINRYGNPCRINYEGEIVIDEQKMHRIMSALSGLLPPTLERMDPRDWNSCSYRLRSFFLPDLAAW